MLAFRNRTIFTAADQLPEDRLAQFDEMWNVDGDLFKYGSVELWDIHDGARVAYQCWVYGDGSAIVFAVGSTDKVAQIGNLAVVFEDGSLCDDAALCDALNTALRGVPADSRLRFRDD